MPFFKNKSWFNYLLWLVGGIIILHHLYFTRDLRGFLWWCTLGGIGIGWLSSVFRVYKYFFGAKEDEKCEKKIEEDIVEKNKKPPFSISRFIGMVLSAYYWSNWYRRAIPEEEIFGINWKHLYVLTPFVAALGVWAVGNTGKEQGSVKIPLIAAYATVPLKYFFDESTAFIITILAAAYAFDTYAKEWKPKTKPQTSCFKRTLFINGVSLIFTALFVSYVYFNATVTSNGEEIPIRDAFQHFLKSPWQTVLKQSAIDLWNFVQLRGWAETYRLIINMSDPLGENNSYEVLELSSSASQSEINAKCRTLSVKYHPDKAKNENERRITKEKFYEIQQACEVLSSNRVKRRHKNKKYDAGEF